MDFKIEYEFPISAQQYWEFTFSDEYLKEIKKAMNLKVYEVLDSNIKGNIRTVKTRTVPNAQPPAAVRKLLGGSDFETFDTYLMNLDELTMDWTNENNLISGDRGFAGGKVRIESIGKNKMRRVIDGRIEVKIPLVGKQIEKFVISQLKERFADQAKFLTSWFTKNR